MTELMKGVGGRFHPEGSKGDMEEFLFLRKKQIWHTQKQCPPIKVSVMVEMFCVCTIQYKLLLNT